MIRVFSDRLGEDERLVIHVKSTRKKKRTRTATHMLKVRISNDEDTTEGSSEWQSMTRIGRKEAANGELAMCAGWADDDELQPFVTLCESVNEKRVSLRENFWF